MCLWMNITHFGSLQTTMAAINFVTCIKFSKILLQPDIVYSLDFNPI